MANINAIENKLKKVKKGTILRLGGMTDCMQPCEIKYRNTYKTIKLLNKYGIGYLIVTKSNLIASNEYINIIDRELAHIQISITSTSDNIAKKYEKASLISQRIKAAEKLQKLGFDVQLRLSPFIEEWIDYNKLNKIQCDKIIVEFLRVNGFIKRWLDIDYTKYSLREHNYYHLPLSEKIKMIENIKNFKEISICEDVDEHYQYWKENINCNNQNKKTPLCASMWNIQYDMTLREYIELYSGATITFRTGDGKKEETRLVKYGEFDKVMDEFRKSNYWRWDAEQTKECRFMPCLTNNKVDVAFIFNMDNDYARELIKNDIFDLENMEESVVRSFISEWFCDKFIYANRTPLTTDRESAILFGVPVCFIEGLLVSREIENKQDVIDGLKNNFPNCYIANLDGKVIRE